MNQEASFPEQFPAKFENSNKIFSHSQTLCCLGKSVKVFVLIIILRNSISLTYWWSWNYILKHRWSRSLSADVWNYLISHGVWLYTFLISILRRVRRWRAQWPILRSQQFIDRTVLVICSSPSRKLYPWIKCIFSLLPCILCWPPAKGLLYCLMVCVLARLPDWTLEYFLATAAQCLHLWSCSVNVFLFCWFFFLVLPVYCYQPISLHPRAHMLSHVIPWTSARQAPLSVDFSRQEYWSGLPFPSPFPLSLNWWFHTEVLLSLMTPPALCVMLMKVCLKPRLQKYSVFLVL